MLANVIVPLIVRLLPFDEVDSPVAVQLPLPAAVFVIQPLVAAFIRRKPFVLDQCTKQSPRLIPCEINTPASAILAAPFGSEKVTLTKLHELGSPKIPISRSGPVDKGGFSAALAA